MVKNIQVGNFFSHKYGVFIEKRNTLLDFSAMSKIPLMLAYDKNDFGSIISKYDEFRIKENFKITYNALS